MKIDFVNISFVFTKVLRESHVCQCFWYRMFSNFGHLNFKHSVYRIASNFTNITLELYSKLFMKTDFVNLSFVFTKISWESQVCQYFWYRMLCNCWHLNFEHSVYRIAENFTNVTLELYSKLFMKTDFVNPSFVFTKMSRESQVCQYFRYRMFSNFGHLNFQHSVYRIAANFTNVTIVTKFPNTLRYIRERYRRRIPVENFRRRVRPNTIGSRRH